MALAGEVRVSRRALRNDFEAVFDGLTRSGGLVWVRAGKGRFLLVNDPDVVREVLVDRSGELVKPRSQAIDTGSPRPERVPGVDVSALRREVTRELADREGDASAAAAAAARAESAGWNEGMRVELMPALRRIAIHTAARGAFATELDAGDAARLAAVLRWLDDAPRVLPASRLSRYSLRARQMRHQLAQVAERLPFRPEAAPVAGELLLGAVGPLTQTAGWLLLHFADQPLEAARLRAEWPATERTSAFVREVTRLHPTNPRITRAALVDTSVGGERVPANTRVVLNVNAINRDVRLYEAPDRLQPDRWLDARPPKFGYLSFGVGERRCLGETFAVAALTAILPALCREWDLDLAERRVTTSGRRQLAEGTVATIRSARAG